MKGFPPLGSVSYGSTDLKLKLQALNPKPRPQTELSQQDNHASVSKLLCATGPLWQGRCEGSACTTVTLRALTLKATFGISSVRKEPRAPNVLATQSHTDR